MKQFEKRILLVGDNSKYMLVMNHRQVYLEVGGKMVYFVLVNDFRNKTNDEINEYFHKRLEEAIKSLSLNKWQVYTIKSNMDVYEWYNDKNENTMDKKTIEFISKNGNKYSVILENNQISLLDKHNNVIEHEILFYNKRDKANIEDFITNVVDGIQLNREQEHYLVKFIYDWYENR